MQPKIGEIITVENVKYITELMVNPEPQCNQCHLLNKPCMDIDCTAFVRQDDQAAIFKEVKEMEVKIQMPDNCELIKDGNTYIVKEKKKKLQKKEPPRSWEEFCKNYIRTANEYFICEDSSIDQVLNINIPRETECDKNICISKEEAEAFLALMQLRQLRKAWVGDWEQPSDSHIGYILYDIKANRFVTGFGKFSCFITLSFPTKEMTEDFLSCFKDLCETAKILL